MPKRGKKKSGDGRDEYEGRPPVLTLGAFFQTPAVQESAIALPSSEHDEDPMGLLAQSDQELASEMKGEAQLFFVTRTKKGKLPITYETRSKGKKVTVINNVSGDTEVLVAELRKRLGVGGVSRGTFVELQGDQQKYVEEFLNKNPACLK